MPLILDGLERLVAGADALRKIVQDAPGVTLLVTTRTRLGIPEEHVRNLGRLTLPPGPDALEQAAASQLFLREAERLNAIVTPEDRGHIVTICRLVHGLPLAILIAAGWLRALSCAQIARELKRGGQLLNEPAQRRPDRREGLQTILAFAWRNLPARERRALRSLVVFDGPFDHPAVGAIGIDLASLRVLCEHALVERTEADRYHLHPLIRRYGASQSANWPMEEAQARARHAAHYVALVARLTPELYERPEAHAALGVDRPNLLIAWEWAVAHMDLALLARMRVGLALWHSTRGLHREWSDVLEDAIAKLRAAGTGADDPALTAALGWLLADSADALHWQGELERVFRRLAEAHQHARAIGMIPLEGYISMYEGRDLHFQGDAHGASERLQQALILSRAIVDRRLEAHSLRILSGIAADRGDYAGSESYLQLAEEIYRDLGDRDVIGWLALHRGNVCLLRADFTRARIYLEQSLGASREFGHTSREGWAHAYLGVVCDLGSGHHREAEAHFTRALAIARETREPLQGAYAMRVRGEGALHTGDLALAESFLREVLHRYSGVRNSGGICRTLLSLGRLALARGDATAAAELAEQTMALASDAKRRHEEAMAQILMGRASATLGAEAKAVGAYGRALALARELALPALCCDAEAGFASVALSRGESDAAVSHAEAALAHMKHQSLAGCEEPEWVAITCHRALDRAPDQRTEVALQLGATLIEQKVASLPAESQRRYLDAFPTAREVLETWRKHLGTEEHSVAPIDLSRRQRTASA
ncbi:MAG: tetratricopeptide repeat protein [Thermomicrobiales bacterium]